MGEQLVAAGMHARDNGNWYAGVDRNDMRRRNGRVEVVQAATEVLVKRCRAGIHVTDVGKTFGPQQRFADIYGGKTDDR